LTTPRRERESDLGLTPASADVSVRGCSVRQSYMVASAVPVRGEFARDGDRDDGAALAASLERMPAGIETPGASVARAQTAGRLSLPAARIDRARPAAAGRHLPIGDPLPLIPFAMRL
jgi:hypothetical protein